MAEWINCFLTSQSSWYFFECYFLLKWYFQKNISLNQLGNLLCNLNTWMNEGIICLEIFLTAPSKLAMVFSFMWSIILDTFWTLSSTSKYYMFLFSVVFILKNAKVYIHTLNSGNIAFYIKTSINQAFSSATTLNIPYIQPNNSHVWLR